MSTPPAETPFVNAPPAAPRYRRHALNMPAGSVRSLLAFMVLASLWVLALYGKARDADGNLTNQIPVTFIYLQYVMILIVGHFFVAHGKTIGPHVSERSPLGLPAGTVRFLLLAGYAGLIVWLLYNKRAFESTPEGHMMLPLVLVASFLLGYVITKVVEAVYSGEIPPGFQDIQAWFALVGGFGLALIFFLRLVILPSLEVWQRFDMTPVETVVAALIGFYFGARS
jgi:hypothetical protein